MNNLNPQNKFENFHGLPDPECALIIERYLLQAIESDVYIEWEIVTKFLEAPYEMREAMSKLFNASLRRNLQSIGNLTISSWLNKYLNRFANIERSATSFFEFVMNDPDAKELSATEKIKLMRVLRMYDYLFVTPIFDLEDPPAEALLQFPMYLNQNIAEIQAEISSLGFRDSATPQEISEKLQLKEALRQYPKIGEQTISSAPLNIKIFDRPVRPSIRNWLYDYTSQLGQEPHDSMQRTNFLFRSENTKNLSSTEREKLGIILKSFDENTPLPIDTENNEVVFENLGAQKLSGGGYDSEHITPVSYQNLAEESFIQAYPRIGSEPTVRPRPVQNNFVMTFQPPETRPPISPQPVQTQKPDTKYEIRDTNKIQFVNPYPAPETHKMSSVKPEMAGEAPVKLKGFSEGVLKLAASPTVKQTQFSKPKTPTPAKQPWSYAPSHPKNIIYPHYGSGRERKPDPKVEGNIVDLSGEK